MEGKLMNKFISMLAAACTFCVVAGSAWAGQTYVGVNAGIMTPTDSDYSFVDDAIGYDTGYDLGASAGYKFNENVRVELAFDYTKADADNVLDMEVTDGDVDTKALMINGIYTVPVGETVGIYGKAGFGIAEVELEDDHWSEDDTVLAGNFGVGLTFALASNVDMDLGWTYFVTEDATIMGEDLSYSDNRFNVGVRYMF
jgi:opacity protein-like surface antigen